MANLPEPVWQKSSYSDGDNNCVEVACNLPGQVLVRDSKDKAGPTLTYDPIAWRSFLKIARS